jgi:hypothetical protein
MGWFPMKGGVQFDASTISLNCQLNQVRQQLLSYATSALFFFHHQFIHVCQVALLPQIILDREGAKTDDLLLKNGTEINLPIRDYGPIEHASDSVWIERLIGPELRQKPQDAVEILGLTRAYLYCGPLGFSRTFHLWFSRDGDEERSGFRSSREIIDGGNLLFGVRVGPG